MVSTGGYSDEAAGAAGFDASPRVVSIAADARRARRPPARRLAARCARCTRSSDDLLMVASDRISAYDVVLPTADPRQGAGADPDVGVLVRDHRPHRPQPLHLRRTSPTEVAGTGAAGASGSRCTRSSASPAATSRARAGGVPARPARSAGSSCRRACASPTSCPEPIFTPATKAEVGDHDENIDFDRAAELIGDRALMEELRRVTLELYEHARDHAAERGIIIADTKFEFGSSPGRRGGARRRGADPGLVALLARRRLRARPRAGVVRQAVRARLARRVGLGPHAARAPSCPTTWSPNTRAKYVEAYERITGRDALSRPDTGRRASLRTMNLFVCGLRRSGTTILYDALREDPELRCFYEPLREDAETIGGGSGARDEDALRRDPRAARALPAPSATPSCRSSCSTGAARERPSSSSSPSLPEHVSELLADLLDAGARRRDQGDPPAPQARRARRARPRRGGRPPGPRPARGHRLDAARPRGGGPTSTPTPTPSSPPAPGGGCGRAGGSPRSCVARRATRSSCRPTSPTSCGRCWSGRRPSRRTDGDGRRLFGDRYVLVRLEDLRADPRGELERIYALLGRAAARRGGRAGPRRTSAATPSSTSATTRAGRARRGCSGWSASSSAAGYGEILELEPSPGSRSTSPRRRRAHGSRASSGRGAERRPSPDARFEAGEGARADPAQGGHPRPAGQGGRAGAAGARVRGRLPRPGRAHGRARGRGRRRPRARSASSCSPTR